MQIERKARQKFQGIDWVTIVLVLGLVLFGLVTIGNVMAEPFTSNETGISAILGNLNSEYIARQIVNFLVGLAGLFLVLAIDYNLYRHAIKYIYIANVGLLVLVLLVANDTRGVMGWFNLGTRAFQPSEICKVTLILVLSDKAAQIMEREGAIKTLKDMAMLTLYFAIPFVLVVIQPDFGTAIVFLAIFICVLFVSKISWKFIVGALVAAAGIAPLSYFYLLKDTQRQRIDIFLNPALDTTGVGAALQVNRSKTAIGSGQLFGKGYFTQGTLAQLKYVPERHTDFIFSGIVEGLGFVGGTVLIAVYFLLIFRWLWISLHAKDHFGTCIAVGGMGMLLAHVFENIGMTIGLMPVTGIPLPFVSYGGSNLLANMMCVGLVLNVLAAEASSEVTPLAHMCGFNYAVLCVAASTFYLW